MSPPLRVIIHSPSLPKGQLQLHIISPLPESHAETFLEGWPVCAGTYPEAAGQRVTRIRSQGSKHGPAPLRKLATINPVAWAENKEQAGPAVGVWSRPQPPRSGLPCKSAGTATSSWPSARCSTALWFCFLEYTNGKNNKTYFLR